MANPISFTCRRCATSCQYPFRVTATTARRALAFVTIAIALWGATHSAAMSSGRSEMHEGLSTGVGIACMLVLGVAALIGAHVAAPAIFPVGIPEFRESPLARKGAPATFVARRARASPIELQRLRR